MCNALLRWYRRRLGLRVKISLFAAAALVVCAAQAAEDTLPEPDQTFVVTVAEKNASHPNYGIGSNLGMVIDGVQGKELILTRGKTYAFKVETDIKHDFYLSTSPVGQGAEVLTDGVTGNFTYRGIVTFTPSRTTPDIAYYQCRNHASMGSKLHIVNPGDEDKVVLGTPGQAITPGQDNSGENIVTEAQVRQKLSFAEMFINQSEAAKRLAGTTNLDARDIYKQSQDQLAKAKDTVTAGDYSLAMATVDEALRLMSEASRLVPSASQIEEQRTRFAELMEGVRTFEASYTKNLERLSKEPGKPAELLDLDHVHSSVQQATKLADDGQYTEANKILASTQRDITRVLSKMLDNTTVVYDKNFATPAEEYQYELARYQSYEELIPIAIEQKQPTKRAVELMDQFVTKAKDLKAQADQEAAKENYPTTIQMLQAATDHLQRALQIAGVR